MLKFFSKSYLSALLALSLLNTTGSSLMAEECYYPSTCNRLYVGAFGGGLYSDSTNMSQTGTAFFTEAEGGPLAVDARGRSGRNSSGFGGAHIGYEWTQSPYYIGCSDWSLTPAAELEAYWYSHTKKGDLINPTARLPEHDFANSFPMNVGVYFLNGVFTLNNCCLGKFSPYVGGGIGVARLAIHKAESTQIAPPELGINHFNSNRGDSSWSFTAQAKAGVRYNICDRLNFFGEYRFLYVDSSRYVFGSTISTTPPHAPTSTWIIDIKNICYNAFTFGLQYDL